MVSQVVAEQNLKNMVLSHFLTSPPPLFPVSMVLLWSMAPRGQQLSESGFMAAQSENLRSHNQNDLSIPITCNLNHICLF